MIGFSAALVVVAIGVLAVGIGTSKLALVYLAIVTSAVALVTLAIGVVRKRDEIFGDGRGLVPADAGAVPAVAWPGGDRGQPAAGAVSAPRGPLVTVPTAPQATLTETRADLYAGTLPAATSGDGPAAPGANAASAPAAAPDQQSVGADPAAPAAGGADQDGAPAPVAVLRGVPRYHEPDCVLIRFMPASDVRQLPVAEAEAAGCTPCAACQPAR